MIQTGISGLINCNSQFTILTFSPTEFEFAVCVSQIQNSYLAVLLIFQRLKTKFRYKLIIKVLSCEIKSHIYFKKNVTPQWKQTSIGLK